MSTPCELTLYHDNKAVADTTASAILNEAKRLEKKYNYFDQNSYLSELNQRKQDLIDPETKQLLQRAIQYYKSTGHIFDITVATLKDLYRQENKLADLKAKRESLTPYLGCEHMNLSRQKLRFDNPYTKIDLGGFVKEYAVDQSVKIIKRNKVQSALVNFGGDIFAVGLKPDGNKFTIGIKDPHNPKQHIRSVELENQALTTSASYERSYTIEDTSFSHIIDTDERSKKPLSVSVISNNCVESGVYSTSLMINPNLECKHQTIIIEA